MQEEIESLLKNETWELVKLPEGKRVISCKWIFKRKEGIPGVESTRNKARFVERGFDQEKGIDFNEVFSLVVRYTSIRILLALVALYDLELEQLDVKTVFFMVILRKRFTSSSLRGSLFLERRTMHVV